jgi:glucosylceramidase
MMSKVQAMHPEVQMYFTEGSTDYNDPHYRDDWAKWSMTYTDVLKNGCRSIAAWNVATDERGKPNIGPYPCGGIVIINAHSQEVIRSGQYWTLTHFSRSIKRGARRVESQSDALQLGHVAAENPGGEKVLIVTNTGTARAVQINQGSLTASVRLKENSIATLVWD